MYFCSMANYIQQHSPEPWSVAGKSGNDGEVEIIENRTRTIAWTANTWVKRSGKKVVTREDRANGRRIVACVNGCAGIADPETTLPEMIEALKRCAFYARQMARIAGGDGAKSAAMADAVLAKLEVRKLEYHNPENLSQKKIGKGWRLLLIGERPQRGDEVASGFGTWLRTLNWEKCEPAHAAYTYRTKRPLPA